MLKQWAKKKSRCKIKTQTVNVNAEMAAVRSNTTSLCMLAKPSVYMSFPADTRIMNTLLFVLRKQYSGWILRTWSLAGWNAPSILSSHLLQWWQVRNHQSQVRLSDVWWLHMWAWVQRLSRCHHWSSSGVGCISGLCSQRPSACRCQGAGNAATQTEPFGQLWSLCQLSRKVTSSSPSHFSFKKTTNKAHGQTIFEALLGLFLQLSICPALWSLLTSAISINTFLRFLFTRVATSEAGSLRTR